MNENMSLAFRKRMSGNYVNNIRLCLTFMGKNTTLCQLCVVLCISVYKGILGTHNKHKVTTVLLLMLNYHIGIMLLFQFT